MDDPSVYARRVTKMISLGLSLGMLRDSTSTNPLDAEEIEEITAESAPVEEITTDGAASNMEDVD